MRSGATGWLISLAVASTVVTLFARPAAAIPPYARKYATACSTCHAAGPKKLNAFGEAFRLNGYQMPGPAELDQRDEQELPLGVPPRKKLFPETIWPGEQPRSLPLGLVAHQRLRGDFDRSRGEVGFEAPHELELVLGGTLGADIGFAGEVVLSEDGDYGGVEGLEVVFTDPLGALLPAGALSIRVGRFAPAAQPFRDSVRQTIRHRATSHYAVALDGFRLAGGQGGVEIFGRPGGRVLWHVGVVNGEDAVEDPTNHKDVYGAVEVKLGGLPYLLNNATASSVKPWRDDSLTIGASGYFGDHEITAPEPSSGSFDNRFWRVSGKLRAHWGDLDLHGAVTLGRDDDPRGTGASLDSLAWDATAEYVVYPWLFLLMRYDALRIGDSDARHAITPSASIFARMNVLFRLEATFDVGEEAANPLAQMELLYAF